MDEFGGTLLVLGRVLLGGFYVYAGVHHFFILPPLTAMISERGVPAPRLVLIGGSVFQVIAGGLFVFGIATAAAAFALIAFTIVASGMLLNFWDLDVNFWDLDGPGRETAKKVWQSNLAIIGGLLIAAAYAI